MIRLESRSKPALVTPYARFERPRRGAMRALWTNNGLRRRVERRPSTSWRRRSIRVLIILTGLFSTRRVRSRGFGACLTSGSRARSSMRCAILLTFRSSCSSSRNATCRRAAQLRHGRSGCSTHPGRELRLFFQDSVLIAVDAHSRRDGFPGPIACSGAIPTTDFGTTGDARLLASLSPGGFDLPVSLAGTAIHRVAPRVPRSAHLSGSQVPKIRGLAMPFR